MNNQADEPSVPGAGANDESRAIVPSQSARDSNIATNADVRSTPNINRNSDGSNDNSELDADSPVDSARSSSPDNESSANSNDDALVEERPQMLKLFQSDYAVWESNQCLLHGLDGGKHYPTTRTFYVDPDARDRALEKVIEMYKEEKQCVKPEANGNEYIKPESHAQDRETNEGLECAKCGGQSSQQPSVSLSLEQLADILFTPGMRFRGHIRIPGFKETSTEQAPASSNEGEGNDTGHVNTARASPSLRPTLRSRNSPRRHFQPEVQLDGTYELIVLKREKDALGNTFILARHRAYDDEQCVHIKWHVGADDIGIGKEGSKSLQIEYEDGETVCKGQWNTIEHRFEGNVRQRLHANDGAFHSRSEVTHVFTLHPCTHAFPLGRHSAETEYVIVQRQNYWQEPWTGSTENDANITDGASGVFGGLPTNSTKDENAKNDSEQLRTLDFESDIVSVQTQAIVSHRHRTYSNLMKALHSLNEFFTIVSTGRIELMQLQGLLSIFKDENKHPFDDDEIMGMFFKLRRVKWIDFLRAQSVYSEQMCAEFRRRAAVLDAAHFETCEQRQEFIEKWKNAGMDLSGAHSIWSDCERLAKNICSLAFAFDFTLVRDTGVFTLEVLRHRLMSNYYCFEGAYRRAESRLATGDLRRYEIPRHLLQFGIDGESYSESGPTCPICQYSLLDMDRDNDDEEDIIKDSIIYKLPCSHCFHSQCVKQWLHNNFSCPVCRSDLTKAENRQPICDEDSVDEA
ncbi:hypothetical protein HJC23_002339 [Cyclotella cryptica]|uniref:RING-type domain-containing protein n=1 Tax=Cyclotella cryptica TaxID=29204 RepID=A0ABD3QM79_9STRA|eukprot:CCRYP_004432-RA/>CCRYP_004432-RA protein AED:0.13 eAED:0.13 QI:0/-1/0/1/-1/1/1/0/744